MIIRFDYDHRKAMNVALWLLHQHGGAMKIFRLMKLVFFADRTHLARYGRPIVGGRYCAMPHGPVASALLNDLKRDILAKEHLATRHGDRIIATGEIDTDVLSVSDIEVLEETYKTYGHIPHDPLYDMVHKITAYTKNWKANAGKRSFRLPYEDFFEDLGDDDKRMLDIIREDQEVWAAFG